MKRLNNLFQRGTAAGPTHRSPPPSHSPSPSTPANHGPLVSPSSAARPSITTTPGGPELNIALQNQTRCDAVYASITGRALDRNNELFLLLSDGHTPYLPKSPASIGTRVTENIAIALGPPGETVTVTIPRLAGGRIYFSIGCPLTFYLNPGPALVEPSVTNPSDANFNSDWGFAEFTFNHDQLYANISYVDFVGPPISLQLETWGGHTHRVLGMSASGLERVCDELRAQHSRDGKGWDQLIVDMGDGKRRVLSPNQGMVLNPALLAGYFDHYVDQAWSKFSSRSMSIDTQAAFGILGGQISSSSNTICFGRSTFQRPSTRDIFSCSTGPFQTGADAEKNCIIPRLAAAFNRSTLLATDSFPADQRLYYGHPITNHYSRIVHGVNVDGKGYAFPYDDVQPSGGADQSGEVHAGDPKLFTVTVGGRQLGL